MKARSTFALATVLLASFVAVAQGTHIPVPAEPASNAALSGKSCLSFCAVAFCPTGSCGPYINQNGQQACGCH